MPASEETGSGPVIHDHRRIDPVTGQVRGRHAASKPAGTTGAGRPAGSGTGGTGTAGSGARAGSASGTGSAGNAAEAADDEVVEAEVVEAEVVEAEKTDGTEEVLEGIVETETVSGQKASDAEARLAERTADLQRLQAEYANYRKRVDRDRAAVREQAVASVLTGLLPVLDAIDQAREHGELSGGFKSVADSLASAVGKLGLVAYGEKGDAFDPKIHEALTH